MSFRYVLRMLVVPELSKRTTRVMAVLQVDSDGLLTVRSEEFHIRMLPPRIPSTCEGVNCRFDGVPAVHCAAVRLTRRASAEPAIGKDIMFPVSSFEFGKPLVLVVASGANGAARAVVVGHGD